MGRPRKLRPEDSSVTASPEAGEVITTTFNVNNAPKFVEIHKNGNEMLPFMGSENIKYGEKRYFVAQGKKLIMKYLAEKGKDKDGKILYQLKTKCSPISKKGQGKILIAQLKKLKIPGADNIGL